MRHSLYISACTRWTSLTKRCSASGSFGELPFERIGLIFGHNAAWARVTYYRAKTQLQKMLSAST